MKFNLKIKLNLLSLFLLSSAFLEASQDIIPDYFSPQTSNLVKQVKSYLDKGGSMILESNFSEEKVNLLEHFTQAAKAHDPGSFLEWSFRDFFLSNKVSASSYSSCSNKVTETVRQHLTVYYNPFQLDSLKKFYLKEKKYICSAFITTSISAALFFVNNYTTQKKMSPLYFLLHSMLFPYFFL